MIKKQSILRVIYILMALIAIASVIAYFVLVRENVEITDEQKEWLAIYITFIGGVLIVNLLFIGIFVHKNLKR